MLMLANKVSGGINLYCLPSSQISWLKKFITIHRWNLLFPDDYRWPLFEVLGMFFKVWSVVWSKACYLKYEAFICGIQNEVLFDYRMISMEFNSCERASYIAKYSLIDCQGSCLTSCKSCRFISRKCWRWSQALDTIINTTHPWCLSNWCFKCHWRSI